MMFELNNSSFSLVLRNVQIFWLHLALWFIFPLGNFWEQTESAFIYLFLLMFVSLLNHECLKLLLRRFQRMFCAHIPPHRALLGRFLCTDPSSGRLLCIFSARLPRAAVIIFPLQLFCLYNVRFRRVWEAAEWESTRLV